MQFSSLKCVNDFSTCFSCFFMMRRMLNYNSRVNVTYSSSFFNIFSVSSLCQWLMIAWSRPVAKPLVSVSPTLFILVILAPMIRGWTNLQCKRFLCARRVSVLERKACALPFTASTREKFATVKQSTWNLRLLLSLHTLLIYLTFSLESLLKRSGCLKTESGVTSRGIYQVHSGEKWFKRKKLISWRKKQIEIV